MSLKQLSYPHPDALLVCILLVALLLSTHPLDSQNRTQIRANHISGMSFSFSGSLLPICTDVPLSVVRSLALHRPAKST
jgi:hypothetical protein